MISDWRVWRFLVASLVGALVATNAVPQSVADDDIPGNTSKNTTDAAAIREEQRTLAEVLLEAGRLGKPVLIAFTAPSCEPCQQFFADVITDNAVRAALGDVLFVAYDIESEPGNSIAAAHDVSELPAFLALDEDGRELLRFRGAAGGSRWFVRLVTRTTEYAEDEGTIREAIDASQPPATVRLKAARWFRSRGRLGEAIENYEKAIEGAPDKAVAAEAAIELAKLTAGVERRKRVVGDASAFVARFPESARVGDELAVAVLGDDLTIERRAELLALAARRAPLEALEKVAYVALAAGQNGSASLAAHRLAGDLGAPHHSQVVLADVYLADRELERAAIAHEVVCTSPRDSEAMRCSEQSERIARGHGEAPTVLRLRAESAALFRVLDDPSAAIAVTNDAPALDMALAQFVPAMRRRFDDAASRCGDRRGALDEVWVRLELEKAGHAPKDVVVLEPGASSELIACLRGALDGVVPVIPEVYRKRYVAAVRFSPSSPRRPAEKTVEPLGRSPLHHAYLYLSGMAGVADTLGAGTRAIIDARELGQFDAMLSWDVNGGVTSEGKAAYGVRALIGLAVKTRSEVARLSLLTGVGASRIGDALPGGYEVPMELVLTVSHQRLRGLAWARTAWIYGAAERKRANALFGGDEFSLGVGVRVPASSPYGTFLATAYSRYANAQTIAIMLGTSVDSF